MRAGVFNALPINIHINNNNKEVIDAHYACIDRNCGMFVCLPT